jgi:hypothetical protein
MHLIPENNSESLDAATRRFLDEEAEGSSP